MHIPDGYLSPSTCAALAVAAAPFWYVALRRVRAALHARLIPLISLFAAFSFVVMMFNLPLPGGTTGHAVGMGVAAIVLGPWASILAISIALTIQAVFFGDGGITAHRRQLFQHGDCRIAGRLCDLPVDRLAMRRSAPRGAWWPLESPDTPRSTSRLCARPSSSAFSRCCFAMPPARRYTRLIRCSIAIPAMMIGHLTLAGLAEMVISAGMVAYLQRTDPGIAAADGARMRRLTRPVRAARRDCACGCPRRGNCGWHWRRC